MSPTRLHDPTNPFKLRFAVGSHGVPNRQARVSKGPNDLILTLRQTEKYQGSSPVNIDISWPRIRPSPGHAPSRFPHSALQILPCKESSNSDFICISCSCMIAPKGYYCKNCQQVNCEGALPSPFQGIPDQPSLLPTHL